MSQILRAAFLALFLLVGLTTAGHTDELDVLWRQFDDAYGRVDEEALAEQADILLRIADVDTPRARKKLLKLRKEWPDDLEHHQSRMKWRREAMVLAALARHGGPKEIDEVLRYTEKAKPKRGPPLLLWRLADVLAQVQREATRDHLRGKALKRATPDIRIQIIRSFGLTKDAAAVPALIKLLGEWHIETRLEAILALGEIGDARAIGPLRKCLKAKDPRERMLAAEALGRVSGPDAGEALCPVLEDPEARVVEAAATAMADMGSHACMAPLIAAMKRLYPEELRAASACSEALEQISGKSFGLDAESWTDWWEAVKDRPFVKDETPRHDRTVPGIPYYGFRIRSSRIAFVIDVSKSMEWSDRLKHAKRELTRVVESLPETTRFNIITFSSDVHAWKDRVQVANEKLIEKAKKFIAPLAPHGGTKTHEALERSFYVPDKAKSAEIADTIVFLSDGSPSEGEVVDPEAILAQVREWNRYRRVRILCIALLTGEAPDAYRAHEDALKAERFMRRLAEENGGSFEVIR